MGQGTKLSRLLSGETIEKDLTRKNEVGCAESLLEPPICPGYLGYHLTQ